MTFLLAGSGVLCIAALYATGGYYRNFAIRQEDVQAMHELELAYVVWYGLWGSAATLCLAGAIARSSLADRALALVTRVSARPWPLVLGAAAVALCGSAALHRVVMLGEPVADDELTYAFQAQTLLHGRLINPLPDDPAFFRNQFVQLTPRGWYGKYPLGHPSVLALGEAFGVRWLVGPILGFAGLVLTFVLGRALFGPTRAALGAALLCLSPQFIGTHATQLSQTTSSVAMLAGAWMLLRVRDDPRLRWAVYAGVVWGFVLLVRPLPGVLFLAVACASHLLERDPSRPSSATRSRVLVMAAAAPGVLAAVALLAWVNRLETGSTVLSAYDSTHISAGLSLSRPAAIAASVGSALIRQNLWLFGWTASLAFVLFARPRRARGLFWGLIAAEYAYRVIAPKTVVASTGPIYVFEIVPLLALATVDGAVRVADALGHIAVSRPRARVLALVMAASLVALCAFVPPQAAALHTGARMRGRVHLALARRGATRALVFANRLVEAPWGATWAYHAPNGSPDLDDAVLFVRLPIGTGAPHRAYAFWRRRFPDRRAFVYVDAPRKILFQELHAALPPSVQASFPDVVAAQGGWPLPLTDPRSMPPVSPPVVDVSERGD